MIDQVTKLQYPGRRNPRSAIAPSVSGRLRSILEELERASSADQPAGSIRCWPGRGDPPTYLFALEEGLLAYVSGELVDYRGRRLIDRGRALIHLADEVLAPQETREFQRESVPGGCSACTPESRLGEFQDCPCSETETGTSLEDWNYAVVVNHNNCYSFARRKRWCGPGQGSQPGRTDSETEQEILQGLARDGLRPAGRQELSGPGSFIALFIEGEANYHFFRLDGDRWTHKFGGYPASACDANHQPILRDGLESAHIPGYTFKGYFLVPAGLELDHCM